MPAHRAVLESENSSKADNARKNTAFPPVCKKCAKMCRAKINHLKQVSDFYAKPEKRPSSILKRQLRYCLFRPSIKCTSTTTIHGRDLDDRTDITLI